VFADAQLLSFSRHPVQAGVVRQVSGHARQIVVEDVHGELDVRPVRGDAVRVRVRGARPDVENVQVVWHGHALVVASGGRPGDPVQLVIEMPVGGAVSVRHVTGPVRVGDTHADVALVIDGETTARVGRIANAELRVAGYASVDVAGLEGRTLDVEVVGSGRVCARGDVRRMNATVRGHGNVYFGGAADEAELAIWGTGCIAVMRVWRRLSYNCVGSGSVLIAHPPREG
jgi:Putative auto-transporter adhesin, head GIN domain